MSQSHMRVRPRRPCPSRVHGLHIGPSGTFELKVKELRVLLVGSRILPFRHAGDKNFWLDVIRGLRGRGHELEVVSVMAEDVPSNGLPLHRVPPVQMFLTPDARFNEDHWHIAGQNNYASKTASLPRIVHELRRRRRAFRPDLIHFIDNYGPAMIGLRPSFWRFPLTISAPTYQPDRPMYDLFLQASFASFNAIAPLSDAYRRRLLELQFPPERVRTIRWGVDVGRFEPPSDEAKEMSRKELGLRNDQLVVLWTGFIQQTGEADLRLALAVAESALRRDPSRYAFLFCFKPEHFKVSYRAFERPGLRVFGSADAFHSARASADVLLSPIKDVRSTAAPPLVWLECLAMGIPIVTTTIRGAEESVVPGQSGFTAATPEALTERLAEIEADDRLRRDLRDGARRIAVERYSVDRALDEYVDLWSTVANA